MNTHRYIFSLLLAAVLSAQAAPWMGNLIVYDNEVWPSGRSGNYGTVKYFLDENAGDTIDLTATVEVYSDGLSASSVKVELYSNLNRRDYAKTFESPANANRSDSYYMTYPMTYVGNSGSNYKYSKSITVSKCGAYRLTARFSLDGGNTWYWHNDFQYNSVNQRDCAVVVSPKKALGLSIYEINTMVVEATEGGTKSQRSTLEDLTDRENDSFDPFDFDFVKNTLGFNTVWMMPIFPITKYRWDDNSKTFVANYEPGSPYSTRNYWAVNEWFDNAGTDQASAMGEFQYAVDYAENIGLNVFIDVAFNHSGRDTAYGQGAVDLGLCSSSQINDWVRDVRSAWCTRGSDFATCQLYYRNHSDNSSQCAIYAPTDRAGEHKWWDANIDWFFGSYSSLGFKQGQVSCTDSLGGAEDERDLFYTDLNPDGGYDYEVENVFNYFAYILPYWLNKTGNKLDGIRADFSQGLPPQAWEYIINKTRAAKWDFIFLAEALDPTPVLYRVNRYFDVMTTLYHGYYRDNGVTMSQLFDSQEDEAEIYGYNACIMHNGTSHDEGGNPDQWAMAARYAVCAASYGVSMVYMGQPLGISDKVNFETAWSNIKWYWDNNNKADVNDMYRRINEARADNPAFQSNNRYFLNIKGSSSFHDQVFSVARWDDQADPNIVLTFVNLNTAGYDGGVCFGIPRDIPLEEGAYYRVTNLAAEDPAASAFFITGAELYNNGYCPGFQYPNEIQLLKLEKSFPNLAGTWTDAKATCYEDGHYIVVAHFEIENMGTETSAGSIVDVYVQDDDGTYPVGTVAVPELEPGESYTGTHSFKSASGYVYDDSQYVLGMIRTDGSESMNDQLAAFPLSDACGDAPLNLSAVAARLQPSVTISWQAVEGAEGYYVYMFPANAYGDEDQMIVLNTTPISGTSYTATRLPAGTWRFGATSINCLGEGEFSEPSAAITITRRR